MRRLLADPRFRLLLAGQTLTMFGDVALFLVLAIWVKDLTGSDGAAGSVFLALVLPMVLAPLAAVWIDRFPRRLVMLTNDVASGALVLCLLFVQDRGDVWIIYAVAAGYGVSQQVFFAARSGLLATWLEDDALSQANGLLESLRSGLRVVGPLAGAALYGAFGGGATAALDAATFFASALVLWRLRVPDLTRNASGEASFLAEVSEGIRHVRRTPELARLVVVFAIALCVVGLLQSALFALVDEGLGRGPGFVGVIATVQGAGSIVGGVAAAWALRRVRELVVIGGGTLLTGLGLAPLALATLPAVFAGVIAVGVGIAALNVGYMTILQRRTSPRLQGRVFAASETVLNLPFAASIGVGAALVGTIGFRPMYVVNGVVLGACGLYLVLTRVGRAAPSGEVARERLHTIEGVVPPG
ncbi:MAG: MFS transporter [Actinomycetota bacterium]